MRGTNSIYRISEIDIEAQLDLARYSEPGLYKGPVQILRKGIAAETEILEIIANPPEITLEMDTKTSRQITLSPVFRGYLETGFELVSYVLEPNYAVIEGPQKLVQLLSELKTDFIDLEGRNVDFSAQVRVVNPNQLFDIRGNGTALFRGFVKETIIINTFENLPVNVKGLAGNLEAVLEPYFASVKVQGVQSKLEGNSEKMLSLYVDCSNITGTGFYELPLLVESETELMIERREPEFIRTEIRRKIEQ
jgi:YbbR domain-containing protein